MAGPKAWDLAAAQAQLASAQAQYGDIKLPNDSQVAQALAQLKKAENDVKQAQDAYDGVVAGRATAKQYGIPGGGLGKAEEQMRAQLEVVRAARDAAQVRYDRAVRGATDAQVRAAYAVSSRRRPISTDSRPMQIGLPSARRSSSRRALLTSRPSCGSIARR